MVLEQFLDRRLVVRHAPFTFLLSALYVLVAYLVQQVFLPGKGIATVLLATLLLVPSLHHLIMVEERLERSGSSHFWRRHRTIIKCYLGAFLGLLAGFLLLTAWNPQALQDQSIQLEQEHLRPETIQGFLDQPYAPGLATVFGLFSHNLLYLLAGFVLSIFYGAGAIFLVAYNASFFAAFAAEIARRWAPSAASLIGISLVHLIPESTGYILTAIAGATISRALIHEKPGGQEFRNVLQNAVLLLALGMAAVLAAAFLETYVSAPFFHGLQ
jgi:uncharacterized membrane protein SpoIIM required for sporulation